MEKINIFQIIKLTIMLYLSKAILYKGFIFNFMILLMKV